MNEHDALQLAVSVAGGSTCAKSRRGVVIFKPGQQGITPAGIGCNAPPHPFRCDGSGACRAACSKVAVHAEEVALLMAGVSAVGCDLLHVKVVDNEAVWSGGPSCWQCSRSILHAGVAGVWLLHEAGLRRYEAVEFHDLTLRACGLPVIR